MRAFQFLGPVAAALLRWLCLAARLKTSIGTIRSPAREGRGLAAAVRREEARRLADQLETVEQDPGRGRMHQPARMRRVHDDS